MNASGGKGVVGGPAMSFVPAGGEFIAEAQRQSDGGRHSNDIFGVPRAEQRAPAHLGGRGIIEERRDGPRQEGREASKDCLPERAKRRRFIRLKRLEPGAKGERVASARQRDTVLSGDEIAGDGEVAAMIAAGQTDLGLRI